MAITKVTTEVITGGAVTTPKIADNAITAAKIPDGTIATGHIADNAVTAAKIPDNVLTATMLPDNVILATHIPNATNLTLGTVTAALTGNASGTAATVTTAAQTNITSLGTLTALTGGTGDLIWDSTTFVVDSSANSVGIGTNTPYANSKLNIKHALTDAYTATDFNEDSVLRLENNNVENNYVGIGFTHVGNTEGFLGYVRRSATTDIADFVLQAYDGATNTYKEYMRIDNAGKVGIGTGSPAAGLMIQTSSDGTGLSGDDLNVAYFHNQEATAGRNYGLRVKAGSNATDYAFRVDTLATNGKFEVDGLGDVGIGGAPGTAPLSVYSDGGAACLRLIGRDNGTSDESCISFFDNGNSTETCLILNVGTNLAFHTNASEKMRIVTAGNVGIGTASPSPWTGMNERILDIAGGSDNNYGGGIRFSSLNGSSYSTSIRNVQNAMVFANTFSDTVRMTLDANGKLQIGGTDDQALLNVTQSDNSYTGFFRNSNASAPYGIKIEYTGSSPNSNSGTWFFYAEDTTEAKAKLRSNGYFYLAGTAYGSDRELKENIVDTPDSLTKLKQIRVRDFNLKGQEELHTGVIAQEIESIFPDLLGEEVISKQDAEVEKKIKTVEYNGLIGILVKSVQELEARLAALEE